MLEKLCVICNVHNTSQAGREVNKMNRKLLLLVFLVVSDCSPLPFHADIFKEGIWKETADFLDHVCRAWPQGFRSLSCQRGRQLLRTLIIEIIGLKVY